MFTGIIESLGIIEEVVSEGTNKSFWVRSSVSDELKPDQSVAHDGVCLTVEEVRDGSHKVTAVEETLQKTTLQMLHSGHSFNIERCLSLAARLDGHMVQGHVDARGKCIERTEREGSWIYTFTFQQHFAPLIVEKGSVALNGISLTVFDVTASSFRITVIPYTYAVTNLKNIGPGDFVNLEFDIIGKYVLRNQLLRN
jgi:riboflavin synthase